ncbi:hypothetical protein [Paenibacillus tengchongensis]|uniref:hypothetical protein n=1 Tax=Paenibacillus tengchongensis TaxID=2608684 RepID=UPI001FE6F46D|nr:hypothetical protein [Paenibacillus tengchongensis]
MLYSSRRITPFDITQKISLRILDQLTSVSITFKPFLKSRKSAQAVITESLPVLFQQVRKVSVGELGEEDIRRLRYCSRHRINFISGTMSPADKNEGTNELESLSQGSSER